MKFGNGCWLQKEGCECFAPQQVYFVKTEPKKVTLCAPTARINHRGDTLGGIDSDDRDHISDAGSDPCEDESSSWRPEKRTGF